MNDLSTQLNRDLDRANAQVLREATALRDSMNRLISRMEAGGNANPMDALGSRPSQFESALGEATTLVSVLSTISFQEVQ